jgi:hypothetical protein
MLLFFALIKDYRLAGHQWLMPVILGTLGDRDQKGHNLRQAWAKRQTLSKKYPTHTQKKSCGVA